MDSDTPESGETSEDVNKDADMIIENLSVSENKILDPLYYQCKTARRMSFVDRLISVTNDGTFGTSVTSSSPQIAHLTDHDGLHNTFNGSRIKKGTETVNQSMSTSFDPNSLVCISCPSEHKIIGCVPITVAFSDQNFVANIAGQNG
jgi:hypothetical protein